MNKVLNVAKSLAHPGMSCLDCFSPNVTPGTCKLQSKFRGPVHDGMYWVTSHKTLLGGVIEANLVP